MAHVFLLYTQQVYSAEASKRTKTSAQELAIQAPSGFERFSSNKIRFKGDAIPFDTYEDWLLDVREKVGDIRRVDLFTKQVNPLRYNSLKSKMEAQWIEYDSNGLKISGAMLVPKYFDKQKKLPVLIYNRGGNARTPLTRMYLVKYLARIAEQGYIVLASNYRGSNFSEGTDEFGGADVEDVHRLVELVKAIPQADSSRIGMMGSSRGAMMTFQVLRADHVNIKAAIVLGAPTDQFQSAMERPDMEVNIFRKYIPNYDKNRRLELERRSAYYWAEEVSPKTPILFLHGTSDVRVGISHSRKMAEKLKSLDRDYKLIEYKYGNHALTFYQEEVDQAIISWLKKHL